MALGEAIRIALSIVGLPAGLCAQVELDVKETDTAVALGTGDVDVLATPRIAALCEKAAIEAIARHLRQGQTTVGSRLEITHLVPVRVGNRVAAAASVERIDGRRIFFNVTVTDRCGLVAAGRVVRVVVDESTFMAKAR